MSLGVKLKLLRREKGLTQAQLGSFFNLAESTISLYEAQKRSPDYQTLMQMASFFEVSVDYLLGHTEERHTKAILAESNELYQVNSGPSYVHLKLPIVSAIKYSPCGLIYEKGPEEKWYTGQGSDYNTFWLQVKDDSMTGDSILPGDYVLIRQQQDIKNGEIGAVVVEDESVQICRIFKKDSSIVLQSANPAYPPRILAGRQASQVKVIGRAILLQREY